MLEDALLVSRAADWSAMDMEPPVCPQCGTVLQSRGQETRTLTTDYDQALHLGFDLKLLFHFHCMLASNRAAFVTHLSGWPMRMSR